MKKGRLQLIKRKWKDDLKMDLKEIGYEGVSCAHLAHGASTVSFSRKNTLRGASHLSLTASTQAGKCKVPLSRCNSISILLLRNIK
jgi:hypothetical protein